MILYHTTPSRNVPSILKDGLLLFYATGIRPAVYLHSPHADLWAAKHVRLRHRLTDEELTTVLRVRVPRIGLNYYGTGLWWFDGDIAPRRIKVLYEMGPGGCVVV